MQLHALDASKGTRQLDQVKKIKGRNEDALIPEVFVEAILDNGAAFGVHSYLKENRIKI